MDKDPEASRRRQVAGSVKELIGKLIGNKQIEDEGAREKSSRPDIYGLGSLHASDPDKPD
ncbi:MAG: CsbD family protein [Rhodococcus sp. (in: high G+C Gram-positive bacteria)]|nr:MAG: CsbD family protein [Rhodococcus sp. (in: high G+C Gram-positive bacteria)]